MRKYGQNWGRDNSLLSEFSQQLSGAVARRKSASALNAAKVEAELASKAKSEFIANMSHELRTPLNAVIGFSDMLQTLEIYDPPRVNQYASYIQEAAEHLLALINGILDVSKIQAGVLVIDKDLFDLQPTIRSCVLIIEAKAKEKSISITTTVADDLPHTYGDALRLKQVLINLLSNAVKFTPEKGTISLDVRGSSSGGIIIEIKDSGIGLSAKEIDTAMRPFGQVKSGFNRTTEGTGLGLPISVALVKLHRGTLSIESERGKGTKVKIELPPQRTSACAPASDGAAQTH